MRKYAPHILFVTAMTSLLGAIIYPELTAQDAPKGEHKIEFIEFANEVWMRLETPAGVNQLRVKYFTGAQFTPKENKLRNTIFFSGGKFETEITEEEFVKAFKDAEELLIKYGSKRE